MMNKVWVILGNFKAYWFCAFLISFLCWISFDYHYIRIFGNSAQGIIIDEGAQRRYGRVTYMPEISFRTNSGKNILFQTNQGSSQKNYILNQRVTVYYMPDNPEQTARLKNFMSEWGWFLMAFIVFLLTFLPVFYYDTLKKYLHKKSR